MKTVLVTGASGFIGRHALGALSRRGYAVHALSRTPAPLAGDKDVEWHRAHLMDRGEMQRLIASIRPHSLLHLAWTTKHGEFWHSPDNLSWTAASIDLLRCFAEQGGARFVGAGTCAEYDWSDGRCEEGTTRLSPGSLYGASKKAFSDILAAYAGNRGLSCAWGRIFFLFGPGEDANRLVPYLIRNCLRKQPAVCRFGQLRRDFLFVDDVADAFAALLDSEVAGAVNIAAGKTVALRDVAGAIARQCGNTDGIEIREDVPAPGEPPEFSASVDRLHSELNWLPRYGLEAGLEHTIGWWRRKFASQGESR